MKSLFAASALLLAVSATPASAEEVLTVHNETGYTISQIFISPTRTNQWEEDILGVDSLPDGETTQIDFSQSEDTCNWDMKAVYDDGEDPVWFNFNLCELSTITLHYDAATGTTTAEYE